MAEYVLENGTYYNMTSSAAVCSSPADLIGIFCASASNTPTIKVWDALSAAAPVVANTFTPSGGSFYPIPARCGTGIYVTIGGTVDCTVFFKPRG